MPYHIDYSNVSLEVYKKKLLETDLVPSRKLLKNDIDAIFDQFIKMDLRNTAELLNNLKTKKKVQQFSIECGVNENYLSILSREIRSTIPKAERLIDFPSIDQESIDKLHILGLKNTKQFWELSLTPSARKKLASDLDLSISVINKISKLSDLSRVRWVNYTFAEILLLAGVKNVKSLADSDPDILYKDVNDLNKKHQWYKAKIGRNDFKLVIEAAKDLSIDLDM